MRLNRYSPFALLLATLFLLPQGALAQHSFTPGPQVAINSPDDPAPPLQFSGGITITQSELLEVTGGGVRCGNADAGYSTENSFYRIFDLSEYPEIEEGFNVTEVAVGIAIPTWPDDTPTQTGYVRLYNLTTPPSAEGIIDSTALELVGESAFDIDGPAGALLVQTVEVSGGFSDDQLMAVSMFLPTGNPEANPELPGVVSMSQGGNEFGTTATEYLASASCGITNPQDISTLGAFESEWAVAVTGTVGAVSNEDGAVAQTVSLGQNYPNPVAGRTTVPFALENAQQVRVSLIDALGREVLVAADEAFAAGPQTVELDLSGLPSGIYVYRVATATETFSRKLVVMQ